MTMSNVRRPAAPAGDEVNAKALLTLLRRYKFILITSTLVFFALSLVVLARVTPSYTASASIAIDLRESNVVDVESVLSGLPADAAAVESEIEVIKSDSLIGRVVDALDLGSDPEFNPALRPTSFWKRFPGALNFLGTDVLIRLGLADREPQLDEEGLVQLERSRVITTVQNLLEVSLVGRSLVIEVSFQAREPERAAQIANAIADQYLVDQLEAKFEATRRASDWLSERLADLEEDVRLSEEAVESYRASQAEAIGVGDDLLRQQVAALNSELILARANEAEARARYNQVASLLDSGAGIETAAEVLSSSLIQNLRQQESELRREEAELATRYGDLHPDIINVRAELLDLRAAMASEVDKIAQSLNNELQVAAARVVALQSSLQNLEAKAIEQNQASVVLNQLLREAEANRLIYENFLNRFKETSDQDDLQQADARIISYANPPMSPSFPQRPVVMGGGIVLGLLVGGLIVFLIEVSQSAFRSSADVQNSLGLPVLATMPLTKEVQRRGRKGLPQYLASKPTSALAEAGRTLRTGLSLTNVDSPPRVVAVTSAVPAEGKSTTAALLAISAAGQGARAVIVDCDLRRPSVHTMFGMDNKKSIVDVLTGTIDMSEAMQPSEDFAIDVLPAREAPAAANALLSSQNFANLVARLRKEYDFVVLDGAPVLPVSDSLIISGLADTTVFVVRWNHTPREVTQSGVKMLADVDLKLGGIVLSQFDQKAASRYDYANYGYYYRRYSNYYSKT